MPALDLEPAMMLRVRPVYHLLRLVPDDPPPGAWVTIGAHDWAADGHLLLRRDAPRPYVSDGPAWTDPPGEYSDLVPAGRAACTDRPPKGFGVPPLNTPRGARLLPVLAAGDVLFDSGPSARGVVFRGEEPIAVFVLVPVVP